MEKIKLYELLDTFSPSEIESFNLFLNSPFYNNSRNAAKLFSIVSEHYPDFSSPELNKKIIFEKIYPGIAFKDKKIRDLFSLTLSLAEDFLAYVKFRNEPLLVKSHSLSQLASRRLVKHFEQKLRELDTNLKNREFKDSDYFFYNFLMLKEKRVYYEFKKTTGKREEFFHDINKEIDQFVLYFVYNMLLYYVAQHNQEILIKHNAQFELIDELLSYLEKRDINNYPAIIAMYNTVLLLKYPDRTDIFYKLRDILYDEKIMLEKEIKMWGYITIYNYSKVRALRDDEDFKEANFRILQKMIEMNVYPLEDNYLPDYAYISIAGEGLIHNEFEWTKNFIEDYKKLVRPENRENAYTYSMAVYNYRVKDYNKSLKLLAKVKTEDFYFSLRVKNHFLKIYFETGEYESALSIVDSFRHFLNSNKQIPDYISSRFSSYVNFMGRILNSMLTEESGNLVHIKNEIAESSNLENRAWMLEQLGKIIKE